MTGLFDVDDYPRSASREPTSGRPFDVEDEGVLTMKFDRDITRDIDILRDNMARARSREDVVYAALKILALAVNRDVIVEGRFKSSAKRISNLWKP
jgi:hypothetical protein